MAKQKLDKDTFRKAAKGMKPMTFNGRPVDWDEMAAKADAMLALFGKTKP